VAKTVDGVWHENKVLCPKCLVPPGTISRYGSDSQGYWFKAKCSHCHTLVKWYKGFDLSIPKGLTVEGVQVFLREERERKKGSPGSKKLMVQVE